MKTRQKQCVGSYDVQQFYSNIMYLSSTTTSVEPLVYIIVLNWNGWQDTIECVQSVQGLAYQNYHILVVDNGSKDNSTTHIISAYPQLDILQLPENLGYSGGNNRGIKSAIDAGADYVWILNNDTIVEPNSLIQLVNGFVDSTIGAAGSKILYWDVKPPTVWFAGSRLDLSRGVAKHAGIDELDGPQFTRDHDTERLSGCSMLISLTVTRPISLFDERYFVYFEEVDLCMRLRGAGLRLRQVQSSIVLHKCYRSSSKIRTTAHYYYVRNHLLFLLVHGSFINVLRALLFETKELVSMGLKSMVRPARRPYVRAHIFAILDFCVGRFGKCPYQL